MPDLGGYKPISDYAVIGNLRSVALVARDGCIDWCCFPHMDSASVFGALLDTRRGGRFGLAAAGVERGDQEYQGDSNVLVTRFASGRSRLSVTDFMPLSGNIHELGRSEAPPEIHRIVECEGRDVEVEVEWAPRFDYARSTTRIETTEGGWYATDGTDTLSLGGVTGAQVYEEETGPVLRARFTLHGGERRAIITRWGTMETSAVTEASLAALHQTVETWQDWAHVESTVQKRVWAGRMLPYLVRSELVLKLLVHADTGAIAAAPTTSLPETIGGVRNWDYRYAWIRDASLTAQALISLGHDSEAINHLYWSERVSASLHEDAWNLQIMYSLHGQDNLEELELSHFEGYRGSRPVRIGNGAAQQFQLEIYGEVLSTGYELARRGHPLDSSIARFLARAANHVQAVWRRPDHGIWEFRGEARHFTYSKVMAWVALDRAVKLAEGYGLSGDADSWRGSMSQIHRQVLEEAYDEEIGAFVQSYGSKNLDAANLRIPLLEFLPFDDKRVQGTIDRTIKDLYENGFVYRYLADDGLPGKEGAFGLCTFWLVDVLALSGRLDEAWRIFNKALSHANQVLLLPEQFDAATGEFLGNFPQAFTHIGLINSALYLAYARGKEVPETAPIGTAEHEGPG